MPSLNGERIGRSESPSHQINRLFLIGTQLQDRDKISLDAVLTEPLKFGDNGGMKDLIDSPDS